MIKSGDVIISSPYADTGIVFSKSVIYIMSHDDKGTSGVIINKLLNHVDGNSIIKALNLSKEQLDSDIKINDDISIYFGGPIEQEKAIILHSTDYNKNSFSSGDEDILINTDAGILKDIALGTGPLHKMLILGYTAWSPNQLLAEMKRNDWLLPLKSVDKKTIYDLIFLEENHSKWDKALKLSGVKLSHYSNLPGNA